MALKNVYIQYLNSKTFFYIHYLKRPEVYLMQPDFFYLIKTANFSKLYIYIVPCDMFCEI